MLMNYGGHQISCSDSKKSSLVIFFRGCPYRCFYCHNKELQTGGDLRDIEEIKGIIRDSKFLISEVIFSGGEPLMQLKAVEELAKYCKSLDLKVGLETSGYDSSDIWDVLKEELIDEVYLDFKTFGEKEYEKLTGEEDSFADMERFIAYCGMFRKKIKITVRTTIFNSYPGEDALKNIKYIVDFFGVDWIKQDGHHVP